MDTTLTPENANRNGIERYSSTALLLADTLLPVSLLGTRAARARLENVPFLTPVFLLIIGACLLIFALTIWSIRHGYIKTHIKPRIRLIFPVFVIGGFLALQLLPTISQSTRYYRSAFMLWWLIVALGLFPLWLNFSFKRFQQLTQTIFIIAMSILIPLLFLELSLRFWFTTSGTEAERVAYIYSQEDIVAQRNRYIGAAYINYGLNPQHPDHNSRGYRGDELRDDATFRIFTIGGSTTYGVTLPTEATYPDTLERLLQPDYPQIEVINAGVPQYASPDSLANFTYRILDDAPDMIIIYHAINDVVIRLVDPTNYTGANPARGTWQSQTGLSPSTLVRFVGISLGLADNPGFLDSMLLTDFRICDNPDYCEDFQMTPQELLDANPPLYFERNLTNLVTLAKAHNIQVVLSTWAYYPDSAPDFEYMTLPHMQFGVTEHNAIIRQLAETHDVPLIDLAATMPVDTALWQDGFHMTMAGTLEQASQYADFLIENNLIPEPDNP